MFDTQAMIAQIIETQKLINKLQEKKDNLVAYLKADDNFEGFNDDTAIIKKYKKRTTVLKEGVDKEQMMVEFPEATKQTLDMKLLASIDDAHKYLELKEDDTLSIQIK